MKNNGGLICFCFIFSMFLTALLFWSFEKDEAVRLSAEQAKARNAAIEMVVK